jgi:CheY-like chemotaxis protein
MSAKLLLADDSITIQRVIELTFADENVEVLAVGDGKEAIARVQADRPDIVLADIGMPEHDGYEVAAFIKSRPDLSHIPVLLLTGAFEPIDEVRARSVGCEGVLVKPFEPQMVISRVRELLNKVVPSQQAAAPAQQAAAPAEPGRAAAAEPAQRDRTDPLENYFDRLDAALATMNTAPPPLEALSPEEEVVTRPSSAPRPPAASARPAQPSIEAPVPVRQPLVPSAVPTAVTPQTASALVSDSGTLPPLHEAFAALLAAERGQPLHAAAPAREEIPDDVIDEVVNRVLVRMGDESMRRAVLDTAERLVREEIEKIKKGT